MSKANVFENDLLKLIFNGSGIAGLADNAATSPFGNLYLALHTADPGEAGAQNTTEVAYTGYARKAVARSTAGWSVVNNVATLAANQDFGECTAGSSTATHFSIGTASSGVGKILYSGALSAPLAISAGVVPRLTNALQVTED